MDCLFHYEVAGPQIYVEMGLFGVSPQAEVLLESTNKRNFAMVGRNLWQAFSREVCLVCPCTTLGEL